MTDRAAYCLFETAIGACGIAWTTRGILRFQLPERDAAATEARLVSRASGGLASEARGEIAQAIEALQAYFNGSATSFDAFPVALPPFSDFQTRVYAETRALGWGKTATYGEIAKLAGEPRGAQAVGVAMSRNPIPIIIPCHRVLASGGKIGGFSAYGGSVTKVALLAMEGVLFDDNQPALPGLF